MKGMRLPLGIIAGTSLLSLIATAVMRSERVELPLVCRYQETLPAFQLALPVALDKRENAIPTVKSLEERVHAEEGLGSGGTRNNTAFVTTLLAANGHGVFLEELRDQLIQTRLEGRTSFFGNSVGWSMYSEVSPSRYNIDEQTTMSVKHKRMQGGLPVDEMYVLDLQSKNGFDLYFPGMILHNVHIKIEVDDNVVSRIGITPQLCPSGEIITSNSNEVLAYGIAVHKKLPSELCSIKRPYVAPRGSSINCVFTPLPPTQKTNVLASAQRLVDIF